MKELRIILTVDNLDEVIKFYRDTVGLQTSLEWHEETGNGIILDAGRASLELIDSKHAERIDQLETGRRTSGPVRLALKVADVQRAAISFVAAGAEEVAKPTRAPWSEVARIKDPGGMQLTLFSISTIK